MKNTVDNEMAFLHKIAGSFPRHPKQLNKLFEADGEILDLHLQSPNFLVAKTDSIREEIQQGLYEDPFLIGWMAVTVSASDLAATGADLMGILLSLEIPQDYSEEWMKEFQRGVIEACHSYQTYIIGGDTNFSKQISVTASAIGTITNSRPLLRKPIRPGNLLYSTGALGAGSALAYARFFDADLQVAYQPFARLKESKILREFATACIDTSDGLFPAISVLGEINQTGINFFKPLQDILCTTTATIYQKTKIPAWAFLAGPHGEYELLFSIAPSNQHAFENACADAMWHPLLLGKATENKKINFVSEEINIHCEAAEIANLFGEAGGNIQHYYQLLMQKHQQWTTKTALYAYKK